MVAGREGSREGGEQGKEVKKYNLPVIKYVMAM